MAAGSLVGTLLLLAAFWLWESEKIATKGWMVRLRSSDSFFNLLLLLYGFLLYLLNAFNRNSIHSFVDYRNVYVAAEEIAKGEEISGASYFLIYPNNFKLALYLGRLFRCALPFGEEAPYYFVLFFSVLGVLAAVMAAVYLLGRSAEERRRYRLPLLFSFVLLLPIYANTQGFYTDTMSFWQAVCGLALLQYAVEHMDGRRGRAILSAAAAGAVVSLGYTVKATVLIPLLAAFMVFSVKILKRYKKKGVVLLLAAIGSFIVVYGLTEAWAGSYEVYRRSKETGNPVISWFAIGLVGTGELGEDIKFSHQLNDLPTKQEKITFTKQYIGEHLGEAFEAEHIRSKLVCNFANGNLGTTDFTFYALDADNLFYQMFSPWGRYFWRISQLCFVYLFAIYTICFLGSIAGIVSLLSKKSVPPHFLFVNLSFLGIILFLMLWESNNRQLYNQMPVILLGLVWNLRQIKDNFSARGGHAGAEG